MNRRCRGRDPGQINRLLLDARRSNRSLCCPLGLGQTIRALHRGRDRGRLCRRRNAGRPGRWSRLGPLRHLHLRQLNRRGRSLRILTQRHDRRDHRGHGRRQRRRGKGRYRCTGQVRQLRLKRLRGRCRHHGRRPTLLSRRALPFRNRAGGNRVIIIIRDALQRHIDLRNLCFRRSHGNNLTHLQGRLHSREGFGYPIQRLPISCLHHSSVDSRNHLRS